MDCADLNRLIHDWELAHVEFKSRRFVRAPAEDHRDLAAALASLANRGGGFLIIGVDDETQRIEEGAFEDKDGLAAKIANTNLSLCSPPTEIIHRYLSCAGSEVLVIEIGKRGAMPHAVVKRKGEQIADRAYYIRNNQGRQLVAEYGTSPDVLEPRFPRSQT